ncbi:MAG: FeoB-associated Cys-rich membrane protein [Oscillospiraceae bacterium]|nr:FeoB-associated Cys-rich membrane protein [Oscillospiraceae bacterium]
MWSFLAENGGTILVLAVVAAVLSGAALAMRRARKAGKGGCGCGCAGCPSRGICHPKE